VNSTPLSESAAHGARVVALDLVAAGAAESLAATSPAVIVHVACRVADPSVNSAMLESVIASARACGCGVIHASTTPGELDAQERLRPWARRGGEGARGERRPARDPSPVRASRTMAA
jgi:hypothetical protein